MILDDFKSRRSIRKFKDKNIEKSKIDILKKVGLLSPSSKNKKEVEFVFVTNKDNLNKLSKVKPKGGKMIKDSALTIVVLAKFEKSDVWIEDASIATSYLHFACHKLGLGSCWVQIRNRMKDYEKNIKSSSIIKDILNIPEKYNVLSMLAVGYPDEIKNDKILKESDFNRIKNEKFKL
ncbi:MAG: nitroreductase family protein [Bacillota bacterium]